MSNNIKQKKAKICFLCKQYCRIYPENPSNLEFIRSFDSLHNRHPLQVVNINEIDDSYTLISEEGRKQAIDSLKTILLNEV